MSLIRIDLNVTPIAAAVTSLLRTTTNDVRGSINRLAQLLEALTNGTLNYTSVKVLTGAVQAAGSVTFTGRPTADETLTICNVTLTAKDSGANGTTQFNTSVTVATTATNLAACINANTTLNKLVTASAALGVVTITAIVPGLAGNAFDLTESLTNATKSAFTGGAETSTTLSA